MTTDPALESIRRWLRSDMRILRWVFLGLYILLLLSLVGFSTLHPSEPFFLICLGVLLAAQAIFIFGAGTIQLCRPIRKRRLVLPVAVSALMLSLLLLGLSLALMELFQLDPFRDNTDVIIFWGLMLLSWVYWGVLLLAYTRRLQRFATMSRLANVLFAGSLAELLATVPSHIIVSRRPGCLVGMGTMMGIIAGVSVMVFSFGPMIVLLFLRPRYRREREDDTPYCAACGYDLRASVARCPECGTPIPAPVPVEHAQIV